MKLKTFRAKTMAEALAQVKQAFGSDAVILSTRTVDRGGVLGVGGKEHVEITAARDMSDLPPAVQRGTLRKKSGRAVEAEGAAVPVSPAKPGVLPCPPDAVLTEVGALKSLVSELVQESRRRRAERVPEQLFDAYQKLIENRVAQEMAQALIDRVRRNLGEHRLDDAAAIRTELARALESMLPTSGPTRIPQSDGPTIIALIGPTGVGKTTTIAKLAANFSLVQNRKVGLITIDTYRIAAVEQLKTYARIINVPLEVATSPEQLVEVVARMADREVILIDTAGRSQRDNVKIMELRQFFTAVEPHEVHLVLSSTGGEAILTETIERFGELGVDRVIFTKLDEAIGFGVVLACLNKANAALSYVTTGQDVPDDIEVGDGKSLAELILDRRDPGDEPPRMERDPSRKRMPQVAPSGAVTALAPPVGESHGVRSESFGG